MKLAVAYAFRLSWTIGSLAQAGVAEDISTPKYSDIRFSNTSVTLIAARGAYAFQRRVGYAKLLDGVLPPEYQPSRLPTKEEHRISRKTDDLIVTNWKFKDIQLQTTDGYCGEGSDNYHSLLYRGKEIPTYLPGCESIVDLDVVGDQLWLGSYEQYEYDFGGGSGVRAISLKSKKLIAAFSPRQKSMDGYVMPLNFDAATGKLSAVKKAAAGSANDGKMIAQSRGLLADGFVKFIRPDVTTTQNVWVLTKTALHRINNGKVTERWYLSEQFDTDGQLTILASLKPQKSNPWAIMARHTKLMDTKPIWKQLQEAPNMAKRVTYEYDDEGEYFSIDGKKISRMATWDHDPSSTEAAQGLINRLKLSKK